MSANTIQVIAKKYGDAKVILNGVEMHGVRSIQISGSDLHVNLELVSRIDVAIEDVMVDIVETAES